MDCICGFNKKKCKKCGNMFCENDMCVDYRPMVLGICSVCSGDTKSVAIPTSTIARPELKTASSVGLKFDTKADTTKVSPKDKRTKEEIEKLIVKMNDKKLFSDKDNKIGKYMANWVRSGKTLSGKFIDIANNMIDKVKDKLEV